MRDDILWRGRSPYSSLIWQQFIVGIEPGNATVSFINRDKRMMYPLHLCCIHSGLSEYDQPIYNISPSLGEKVMPAVFPIRKSISWHSMHMTYPKVTSLRTFWLYIHAPMHLQAMSHVLCWFPRKVTNLWMFYPQNNWTIKGAFMFTWKTIFSQLLSMAILTRTNVWQWCLTETVGASFTILRSRFTRGYSIEARLQLKLDERKTEMSLRFSLYGQSHEPHNAHMGCFVLSRNVGKTHWSWELSTLLDQGKKTNYILRNGTNLRTKTIHNCIKAHR